MLRTVVAVLICAALMFAAPAFAVDGVVLINQSTVLAAGGFPYKITQPGSYKLSGNLVVPANVDGIDILADGVTVDLNGFRISGPGTCTGEGAGISCVSLSGTGISGSSTDVTIRNGSIVGFSYGIYLLSGSSSLVEEIHASGNAYGIIARDAVIRRNITSSNVNDGIYATYSTITENVSNFNGGYGLVLYRGVYGSNTFESNGFNPPVAGSGVPQNNNDCNGITC
jgi:nitrous oxidase accessory protein NosD